MLNFLFSLIALFYSVIELAFLILSDGSFILLVFHFILFIYFVHSTIKYYKKVCYLNKLEKFQKEQKLKENFKKCKPEDIIDVHYKEL